MGRTKNTEYATESELRAILNKWKNSEEKLKAKELRQVMFCVEDYLSTREFSSWNNCNSSDIGWG